MFFQEPSSFCKAQAGEGSKRALNEPSPVDFYFLVLLVIHGIASELLKKMVWIASILSWHFFSESLMQQAACSKQ